MVKIIRCTFSIIAYDESENRGILFPVAESTKLDDFVTESREVALSLKKGLKWTTLVYNPMYVTNYRPMEYFLHGRKSDLFRDDREVVYLYKCYFYYVESLEKNS